MLTADNKIFNDISLKMFVLFSGYKALYMFECSFVKSLKLEFNLIYLIACNFYLTGEKSQFY